MALLKFLVTILAILGTTTFWGTLAAIDLAKNNGAQDINPTSPIEFGALGGADLLKVRAILAKHKTRLRNRFNPQQKIPQNDAIEALIFGAKTAAFDMMPPIGQKTPQTSKEKDTSEEFKKAPEILHVNKHLSDYLYQGDMALTTEQAEYFLTSEDEGEEFSISNLKQKRQAINGRVFPKFRWDRQVPFLFDGSIDSKTKALIVQGLDFWASHTCLQFFEQSQSDPGPKIRFYRGSGCFSYVGKIYAWQSQPVSIGQGCEHLGVITHEVAHALGFFHAQSRFDRDSFVNFRAENVADGFEDQFDKESPDTNDNQGVAYDYGSVMHYSEVAFARTEDDPVLVANEKYNQNTMGQRMQPSFSDVLVMNKHYNCLEECANSETAAKCVNDGYPHPRDCSKCICPWGFGGDLCDQRQSPSEDATCGESIKATSDWQELTGSIGETSKVLKANYSSCHWHIIAPEGRQIQLEVTKVGRVCSPGCFYGNVEFKVSDDFGRTGIRMCCAKDLTSQGRVELTTDTRLAVISLYSRFFVQHFKLKYKVL